jgi:hypothetical protein
MQDRGIVGILGIGGLLWTSTCVFGFLGTPSILSFESKKIEAFSGGRPSIF